ncbi:hypothetical protein R54767_04315 [Paraburkholderia gardini]|uniref:Uncharacterized protein n=1 Tax=Paraburkholderia gardini TaxID=2823469 RepID=A0ABM8U990_9BURK|nr:hypothetical protein R54767_04315 [Paraburkholderia gardini]
MQRREDVADDQHHREFGDTFQLDREAEHGFRHKRMGLLRIGGGRGDIARLDGADGFPWRLSAARSMLDATHRDARCKNGEKAERMCQLRDAVRQLDQPEREKGFEAEGLRVTRS